LADGVRTAEIHTNDQLRRAEDYMPLIVAHQAGRAVRLTDVARVEDSVEDLRNTGLVNGRPSVLVVIFRQPGANIIDTVDRVTDLLPQLEASIPGAINVSVVLDRSTTIRASLHDVERALIIAVILVTLVVFGFLRTVRATLIPSVAVPVSLISTFGVMYLLGYSLDNLSLMALTSATGFVVYDASLSWVLLHPRGVLAVTLLTIAVNIYLFVVVPKGFFPQQDTGRLTGAVQAAQDISFQAMQQKLAQIVDVIKSDPAVESVMG